MGNSIVQPLASKLFFLKTSKRPTAELLTEDIRSAILYSTAFAKVPGGLATLFDTMQWAAEQWAAHYGVPRNEIGVIYKVTADRDSTVYPEFLQAVRASSEQGLQGEVVWQEPSQPLFGYYNSAEERIDDQIRWCATVCMQRECYDLARVTESTIYDKSSVPVLFSNKTNKKLGQQG